MIKPEHLLTVGTLYETTETFVLEPMVHSDIDWLRYDKGSTLLLINVRLFDDMHAHFTFLDNNGVLGYHTEYYVIGTTAKDLKAVSTP